MNHQDGSGACGGPDADGLSAFSRRPLVEREVGAFAPGWSSIYQGQDAHDSTAAAPAEASGPDPLLSEPSGRRRVRVAALVLAGGLLLGAAVLAAPRVPQWWASIGETMGAVESDDGPNRLAAVLPPPLSSEFMGFAPGERAALPASCSAASDATTTCLGGVGARQGDGDNVADKSTCVWSRGPGQRTFTVTYLLAGPDAASATTATEAARSWFVQARRDSGGEDLGAPDVADETFLTGTADGAITGGIRAANVVAVLSYTEGEPGGYAPVAPVARHSARQAVQEIAAALG
ncbi:hypothetical protein [Nocardiopsis ansamitocini]|uniref:hypothetical protein n=1 Tax=Nocardiopsis ansamitocini TaxID=1670832 RepID=UPI00255711E0|nr:hypothetical protein [Nocardiopsis ansamitocini]